MKVFVYGHYDSRGGTTAIEAESKEKADHIYNEELFAWSETHSQLVGDSREAAKVVTQMLNPDMVSPAQEDFLYEALLENAPAIEQDSDLECDLDGEVWIADGPTLTEAEAKVHVAELRESIDQERQQSGQSQAWFDAVENAIQLEENGPFRPDDQPVRLRFVPVSMFAGPMERVIVGHTNIEWHDENQPGWREHGYYKDKDIDEEGTVWDVRPTPMIRFTTPDGSVHEMTESAESRLDGWTHPSWEDDAYCFILMRRTGTPDA